MMSTTQNKIFGLLDANNFYVSCERVFQPKLQQIPVIVLSNNDGCAIARSNEAKQLGIKMGEPLFKFKHLIKKHNVAVLSPNFALYGDFSARLFTILMQELPEVMIYSIDEAFLDLSSLIKNYDLISLCTALANKINRELGLPVSIGIGATKTIAKIASQIVKNSALKTAVYHLTATQLDQKLAQFPIGKIWGVGKAYTKKLTDLGYNTAFELKQLPQVFVKKYFNINLAKTIAELHADSIIALNDLHASKKQIIVSRSFGQPINTLVTIQAALATHLTRAAVKLRVQNSICAGIIVFLQTNLFNSQDPQYQNSQYIKIAIPSSDTRVLLKTAMAGLKLIFRAGYSYKKVGVILTDLRAISTTQFDLFAPAQPDPEFLMDAIDLINKKFGKHTIDFAVTKLDLSWHSQSANKSPDFTTDWQQLPTVFAK